MTLDELEAEALHLPVDLREELIKRLILSLESEAEEISDAEYTEHWEKEIHRRLREIEEGTAELVPAEKVFEGIREFLREHREAKD